MDSSSVKADVIDINDAFDSIVCSEDKLVKQGFADGFIKGVKDGEANGFHLGYHRGAEFGAEVGFYKGVVKTWLALHEQKLCTVSEKTLQALRKVEVLINQFPLENDDQVDLTGLKDNISVAFKKACSLLKFDPSHSSDFSF